MVDVLPVSQCPLQQRKLLPLACLPRHLRLCVYLWLVFKTFIASVYFLLALVIFYFINWIIYQILNTTGESAWCAFMFHLKVTGPESVEISWRPPEHPNGIIIGYELRRDGEVIYVGTETHYHDFILLPSVEYNYVVRANNSRGAVSSTVATAKTHPSAPSGVGLPTLTPVGPNQASRRLFSHCEWSWIKILLMKVFYAVLYLTRWE